MSNHDSLSMNWILSQGSNRTHPPDEVVFDTVVSLTGFDLRPLFKGREDTAISEAMRHFPDFTFLRSPEETNRLARYCPFEMIAPFGVDYNLPPEISEQEFVDGIDVYGVCFEGQFANTSKVVAWSDHAIVNDWESLDQFLVYWSRK